MDYAIVHTQFDKEKMQVLEDVLNKYNIFSKLAGKVYIEEVLQMLYSNRILMRSLDQFVYPIVAKKNGTRPANVEKNIKNAVAQTKLGNGKLTTKNFLHLVLRELDAKLDSL